MVREEWPERDELVVCTVRELKTFGAFVTLDEYEGKEGLIHISRVSSGWVKHLRDFVREGQKIVCKVLHVDAQRGHIDLSLKEVKDAQKRERIKLWKNEKKAKKWLSLVASSTKPEMTDEELTETELKLVDAYGSLYDAFVEMVKKGKEVLSMLEINEEHAEAMYELALANVKPPSVQITGYMELKCPLSNGVDIIKEALNKAEEELKIKPSGTNTNDAIVECFYIGAPKYKIRVTASDYKKAESVLSNAVNASIKLIEKNKGYGIFYRNLP